MSSFGLQMLVFSSVQFGRQYVHCDKCRRCVKPSWSHCNACDTCELTGRHTTSLQSTGYMFIFHFTSEFLLFLKE